MTRNPGELELRKGGSHRQAGQESEKEGASGTQAHRDACEKENEKENGETGGDSHKDPASSFSQGMRFLHGLVEDRFRGVGSFRTSEETEDPGFTRVEAGNCRGPGDGRLGRIGRCQWSEVALACEACEVRKGSLVDTLPNQYWIQAVDPQQDDPIETGKPLLLGDLGLSKTRKTRQEQKKCESEPTGQASVSFVFRVFSSFLRWAFLSTRFSFLRSRRSWATSSRWRILSSMRSRAARSCASAGV